VPTLRVNDATLHYEEAGAGPEAIVFAHGLLLDGRMFADQVEALKKRYRCITFDSRGQGESEVTASGYDMDTLAVDAAALIEALQCAPCHFAGLSMGGFVGLRLAIRRPALLRSLILLETSADPEPRSNIPRYRLLNFIARWFGLRLVVDRVMPILFGKSFLADSSRKEIRKKWRARIAANDRIGITRAVRGVLDRAGVDEDLNKIAVPTLIVVGDQDVATVPAKAERLHARIAGSQLVVIPNAGHSSPVEEPEAVTSALRSFLASLPSR
jgi:3-oxoadipate enol-lactonase